MAQVNLKEIVHPEMAVLFVALNPPEVSNNHGHYFSYNLSFWNVLYKAGLITQPVLDTWTADEQVFRSQKINYKCSVYGITDLVHDQVETNSSKVSVDGYRVGRILRILDKNPTKVLCLMHSRVAIAFQKEELVKRRKEYGLIGTYKSTRIFEVPFHNAPILNKEQYYSLLIKVIR